MCVCVCLLCAWRVSVYTCVGVLYKPSTRMCKCEYVCRCVFTLMYVSVCSMCVYVDVCVCQFVRDGVHDSMLTAWK